MTRAALPALLTLTLAACGLPKLGGEDPPPALTTLASTVPEPAPLVRERAVTFAVPLTPEALATTRVAAVRGGTAVAYIQDLLLVDSPDRLFQQLVSETVYRSTDLLVVDPRQQDQVPALKVTGTLYRFDFDADTREVVVGYEALWADGGRVASRRFEAREPAVGYAGDVAPALNRAANRVAAEVAAWITGG
ncbi:ABC-type transport auxiliary lipoprotein family protein [Sphingomicrobium astaxanthinifaciens]|uniref:ABC-type transport auxiliary lipoprotein family protein n=1 Tax=Sphingomicrobium astaxanthinifaciens TaxID=1227949 RepID=UPI001FCC804E|nr:ABC-type transport auxiliary lipoprotein family protein [Sphingomicrobium astaxanthinifaciens]MCJ7421458.1 ABC-type transport auxiliary lipoprotein family protein [Sphingomicrobium astaxanthinifaciens]